MADAAYAANDALHDWTVALSAFDAVPMLGPAPRGPTDTAHFFYTSGTTGMPKSVMVQIRGVAAYLAETREWTRFTADDQVAESCDITFDLTVHSMFLCWEAGTTPHIMSPLDPMAPARFIRQNAITGWLSVFDRDRPDASHRIMKPGIFPSLRVSAFCGEPLPLAAARAWAEAAPNSRIENI